MHGDQGGRTVEFDRHRRPRETQPERDRPHRHARRGAEIAHVLAGIQHQVPVLAGSDPCVDAGAGAAQRLRIQTRIFECAPARLQQEPVLRVHGPRPDRGDSEETSVEPVDPFDESAAPRAVVRACRVSGDAGPRPAVRPPVEDGLHSRLQLAPEGLQVGSAGEAARHPDDGDAVRRRRHFLRCGRDRRRYRNGERSGSGLGLGCGGRRLAHLAQFLVEVGGEPGDVRIVEDHGVGSRIDAGERPVQPVPELDRHQRVHAQVEEPDRRRRCGGKPQHRLHFPLEERDQQVLPLPPERSAEPGQHVLGGRGRLVFRLGGAGKEVLHERRPVLDRLLEDAPVHRHDHGVGDVLPHQPVERPDALLGGEPTPA